MRFLAIFLVLAIAGLNLLDAREARRRGYNFGGEGGEGVAAAGRGGESSSGASRGGGESSRSRGISGGAFKNNELQTSPHKINLGLGVGWAKNQLTTRFNKQQIESGQGATYDVTYNFPSNTFSKNTYTPALNISYQLDAFRFLGFRVGAWATYAALSHNETSKNITVAEVNRDGIFVGANNQINANGNGMVGGSASMVFEPFAKPISSKITLTHLNVNLHFDTLVNLLVWKNYTLGGVLGLEAGFSDIRTSVENAYQFSDYGNGGGGNVEGTSSHKFAHKIVHFNLTVALRNVIANAHAIELGARIPFGVVASGTTGASYAWKWGAQYPIEHIQRYAFDYKPKTTFFLHYIFSFSL